MPLPSPVPGQQPGLSQAGPGGQIQPGTITYTTSTSPDGRLTYHPFKAVPVSYQTNAGVVSGIQWIPAEATSVIPAGARPADEGFTSSWNRGHSNKDDKALREWQKDEERRIHKEEKEAKRIKKELRQALGSINGPYGAYTNPMNDLERRMDNVDLGRARKSSMSEYGGRRRSTYTEAPIAAANPGYAPAAGYGISPYPPTGPVAPDPYQRAASPYHGAPEQAILSRSRAPSPNPMAGIGAGAYGPRSRAPSPIPGALFGPRSRAPSPIPNPCPLPPAAPPFPYPGALPRSPHVGGGAMLAGPEQPQMLPPPDGFSRPANLAQSYTFFETMKIQDMDDFYDNIPRMPMVLVPHDVYHEDWIRLCQDLALAWGGKLPTTDPSRSSRPSVVAAELVELWNTSFFASRGVELVLFKGHERRSGQGIGQIERNLPGFGNASDSESSDSTSSDSSDLSDDKYGRGGGGGYYGSHADSKRKKAERKAEKKRKHKEKKARRRARERERTYALYITCVAPREY
ncbi:hypothetical protein EDB83DRAFT_2671984 [Lactarius deliciosus]|nr:hypothetical protein EDB83DRAFT_2671984 [Lactarius deliciosus]